MSLFNAIVPFIWTYGIGGAILAAAGALFFITAFKRTAAVIAVATVVALGAYTLGVNDGKSYVQFRWDRAEAEALKRGVNARDAAEKSVPRVDPAAPPGRPCGVPDRYDRDCS